MSVDTFLRQGHRLARSVFFASMGVGRIFPGGALGDFFKIFLGLAKSGEICFFPFETKETTCFAKIFQI